MNSLEHFNLFYQNEKKSLVAESLEDFFHTIVAPRLNSADFKILDLGSGSRSIFEELELPKNNISAIDFSEVAVSKANSTSTGIKYEVVDLTVEKILEDAKYGLIFDSHCLHCIEGEFERKKAFENIYRALTSDGLFCAEMMIQSERSSISLPFKHIPTAHKLEQELGESGFTITYFFISKNLKFYNDSGECDLLRVVCKK